MISIAAAVLAIAACRSRDARPIDAAPVEVAVDATPIDAALDAAPAPPPTATRLVAAGDSTCAVMSDLTLRCWGANQHGQLGNGATTDTATPATPAIRAVKDLQLADATACALLDDGSVACWGRIAWHGHAQDVLRPTGDLGVTGVTQIFVLDGRACARLASSSLVCWGNVDARGHFAVGPTHRAPTVVVGLDHIAALTAGAALSDDGRMWTWAADGEPRLVDTAGAAVEDIAERDGTVCGRLHDGRVMCATSERCGPRPTSPSGTTRPARPGGGARKPAKLGPTSKPAPPGKPTKPSDAAHPDQATGDPAIVLGVRPAKQLAFGLGFCVVTATHQLQCGDGCRRIDPPTLARIDHAVGRCVQLTTGAVTCFDGRRPTKAPGIAHATSLVAGRAHACALDAGRITCWGANDHGQLGDLNSTR